ncbi:hypothetical protein NQ176_g1485 [Zarea fungicola]|uniref:Uncharacterized protein n=1 Tax=Zarea fungicola TaxID=93591 RepID=A0ACC1NSH2_9HYPO|nr:hypothetical protein NQ176_g1485 [Lecanicillium fungicola]
MGCKEKDFEVRNDHCDSSDGTIDEKKVHPSTNCDAIVAGGGAEVSAKSEGEPSQHPDSPRSRIEIMLIMLALCLAVFLAALDVTIVATAIPTISSYFNSNQGYIWIGSAYTLGSAAFVPTWGKISDIFGRKPILILCVAIFWIGSLLCAVSINVKMLIAGRIIQGIGSGGIIVLPSICVSDLFSIRKRGAYFSILGMVWAVASAIGPILGGAFSERVSWRWCFYINLPLSGISMLILIFVLKLYNPRTPIREGLVAIDWLGSLLAIGGTVMILLGLQFGGVQFPWASVTVICLIVFGTGTIGLFILCEAKYASYPIMPVRLFSTANNFCAYVLTFMHSLVVLSVTFFLPLYFQSVLGASPLLSGCFLLPFALALSIVLCLTGAFIRKTGIYKLPIAIGMFITALGIGLFTDLGNSENLTKIILFLIITGAGLGFNFQAPLIALQTNAAPGDIAAATSAFSFTRQLGNSISVVIGGSIFNNEMKKQHSRLLEELGPQAVTQFAGPEAASMSRAIVRLNSHDAKIVRGAYWDSLQRIYIVFSCFAFIGFLLSFGIRQTRLNKDHEEHKTGLRSLVHERAKASD